MNEHGSTQNRIRLTNRFDFEHNNMRLGLTVLLQGVILYTSLTADVLANAEVLESVTVHTHLGGLAGFRVKTHYHINNTISDTYDVFRGIPYALPPVKHRRFQPPEPITAWKDIRDATQHGPVCPQTHIWVESKWEMNEDCLYLSIYTPYEESSDTNQTYAVIVFIHGGSYEVGTERLYDGGVLSLHGLVLVFINYRLGILGFLASGDDMVKGNYGLLDQIQALKWTQENIHYFRGNPKEITIMGQSVGSSSVGLLLASPLTQGIYQRVIMQSGAVLARYSFQSAESTNITQHFIDVGQAHNCPVKHSPREINVAIYDCLVNLPWNRLIYDRHHLPRNDPVIPEFRPVIDNYVLPEDPRHMLLRNEHHGKLLSRVPILQGTVQDEMSPYTFWDKPVQFSHLHDDWSMAIQKQINPVKDSILLYIEDVVGADMLTLVKNRYSSWSAEHGSILQLSRIIEDIDFIVPTIELSNLISDIYPVYQYYFAATEISYHLVDLNYIFGSPFSGRNYDDTHRKLNYNISDKILSSNMMALWSHFAKTGKAVLGDMEFPTYSVDKKEYIHIGTSSFTVNTNLRAQVMEFWTVVIPQLKETLLRTSGNVSGIDRLPCYFKSENSLHSTRSWKHDTLITVGLLLTSGILGLVCAGLLLYIFCSKNRKNVLMEPSVLSIQSQSANL